jgi:hypothetical protein
MTIKESYHLVWIFKLYNLQDLPVVKDILLTDIESKLEGDGV